MEQILNRCVSVNVEDLLFELLGSLLEAVCEALFWTIAAALFHTIADSWNERTNTEKFPPTIYGLSRIE